MRQCETKCQPAKNQAVHGDADRIADEYSRPLVFLRNTCHPEVIHFRIDELGDDFCCYTGNNNSPHRAQNARKFPAQPPGSILWQPGGKLKESGHKQIDAGCQGALMAPTEVLAEQHYQKLCAWMPHLHVSCALLTGSTPMRRRRQLLSDLADDSLVDASASVARMYGRPTVNREELVEVVRERIGEWRRWQASLEELGKQSWT